MAQTDGNKKILNYTAEEIEESISKSHEHTNNSTLEKNYRARWRIII